MAISDRKISPEKHRKNFADIKPALSESAAIVEAGRCLFCYDAPCTDICPTHIDVPGFIKKIMTGNYLGSAKTILTENILGESCGRACPVEVLCEGACVMNDKDEMPIKIGQLQRFSTEWRRNNNKNVFDVPQSNGKSVGLIGAGPASLSCAAYLKLNGYDTLIYEAEKLPGGLDAFGVAEYKLTLKSVLDEIEMIKDIGVEIQTETKVGKDISFDELLKKHDALFIGIGLGQTRSLEIPGSRLNGVRDTIDFIKEYKTNPAGETAIGKNIAVIGGGNTSVDAATAAVRLGAETVTILYRRSESEMPAFKHEYEHAKADGVIYKWLANPVEFLGDTDVDAVKCVRMELGEPDESGRRQPIEVSGSEFTIPADMVFLALGQVADEAFIKSIPGIGISNGKIVADPKNGKTSNPKIFAGGDVVHGAMEVVNAVQAGKLAAVEIAEFLSNGEN
ncbi:MAG: NAD(P)-dependent oxidoreductase [Candidatus Marinimicrobia bacterium]|nr:NAD(P)-dependent oxidoreductase [Candidatus Neomarinimicrobiota bacterium]